MVLKRDATRGFGAFADAFAFFAAGMLFSPLSACSADPGITAVTYGPNRPERTSTTEPSSVVPSTRAPPELLAMSSRALPAVSSSGAMPSGTEARRGVPSADRFFVSSTYGP